MFKVEIYRKGSLFRYEVFSDPQAARTYARVYNFQNQPRRYGFRAVLAY